VTYEYTLKSLEVQVIKVTLLLEKLQIHIHISKSVAAQVKEGYEFLWAFSSIQIIFLFYFKWLKTPIPNIYLSNKSFSAAWKVISISFQIYLFSAASPSIGPD